MTSARPRNMGSLRRGMGSTITTYPFSTIRPLKTTQTRLNHLTTKMCEIKTVLRLDISPYYFQDSIITLKMTVRGTMVRSEVCNAWCFCLGSYIQQQYQHFMTFYIIHFITFGVSCDLSDHSNHQSLHGINGQNVIWGQAVFFVHIYLKGLSI